jgi:hypothetical protein
MTCIQDSSEAGASREGVDKIFAECVIKDDAMIACDDIFVDTVDFLDVGRRGLLRAVASI